VVLGHHLLRIPHVHPPGKGSVSLQEDQRYSMKQQSSCNVSVIRLQRVMDEGLVCCAAPAALRKTGLFAQSTNAIQPLNNYVFVKSLQPETQTASGIFLPQTVKHFLCSCSCDNSAHFWPGLCRRNASDPTTAK
jgi:hypothetical protein